MPNSEDIIHTIEIEIINQRGLHARASAKFVKCVESYDVAVKVTRNGETVGGRSIMGLMMLAASQGTIIQIEAQGKEAAEAIVALTALINNKFGEGE